MLRRSLSGLLATSTLLPFGAARAQTPSAPATASAAAPVRRGPVPAASAAVVQGVVTVLRNGQTSALRRGAALAEGDTIQTGDNAEVLLRFADGARSAIRPNSSLEVKGLKLNGPVDERRTELSLLKGALRYISGKLTRRDGVRFTTPTATIGIRGTDIEIAINPNASDDLAAGTVLKVNSGVAVMDATDGTRVDVTTGDFAIGTEPELTPRGGGKRRPAARTVDAAAKSLAQQALGKGKLDNFMR
jgi:hypothetical protein